MELARHLSELGFAHLQPASSDTHSAHPQPCLAGTLPGPEKGDGRHSNHLCGSAPVGETAGLYEQMYTVNTHRSAVCGKKT